MSDKGRMGSSGPAITRLWFSGFENQPSQTGNNSKDTANQTDEGVRVNILQEADGIVIGKSFTAILPTIMDAQPSCGLGISAVGTI